MNSGLIIFSAILSLVLLILKVWSNFIKNKELSIDFTHVLLIASIGIGISVGIDFLRIVILSQTTTALQFFKPYSTHLIYTMLVVFSVSVNSINSLKIKF